MHVANVCRCASVVADRGEVDDNLFARVQAELFEKLDVLGVEVLAVLLKELLLLREEGDVA